MLDILDEYSLCCFFLSNCCMRAKLNVSDAYWFYWTQMFCGMVIRFYLVLLPSQTICVDGYCTSILVSNLVVLMNIISEVVQCKDEFFLYYPEEDSISEAQGGGRSKEKGTILVNFSNCCISL